MLSSHTFPNCLGTFVLLLSSPFALNEDFGASISGTAEVPGLGVHFVYVLTRSSHPGLY